MANYSRYPVQQTALTPSPWDKIDPGITCQKWTQLLVRLTLNSPFKKVITIDWSLFSKHTAKRLSISRKKVWDKASIEGSRLIRGFRRIGEWWQLLLATRSWHPCPHCRAIGTPLTRISYLCFQQLVMDLWYLLSLIIWKNKLGGVCLGRFMRSILWTPRFPIDTQ